MFDNPYHFRKANIERPITEGNLFKLTIIFLKLVRHAFAIAAYSRQLGHEYPNAFASAAYSRQRGRRKNKE